jgi:hypothetical protein
MLGQRSYTKAVDMWSVGAWSCRCSCAGDGQAAGRHTGLGRGGPLTCAPPPPAHPSRPAHACTHAAGCILAEVLRRRPLFAGADYMSQLVLIVEASQ